MKCSLACAALMFLSACCTTPRATDTPQAATASSEVAPPMQIDTKPSAKPSMIPIASAPSQAIRQWLKLVDAGSLGESWDAAAPMFQAAVTRADWAAKVDAARAPLGHLASREQVSTREVTSLPGAPDGDYYIYEFHSSFANKAEAVETVTVQRGTDDHWRVVGYFVR